MYLRTCTTPITRIEVRPKQSPCTWQRFFIWIEYPPRRQPGSDRKLRWRRERTGTRRPINLHTWRNNTLVGRTLFVARQQAAGWSSAARQRAPQSPSAQTSSAQPRSRPATTPIRSALTDWPTNDFHDHSTMACLSVCLSVLSAYVSIPIYIYFRLSVCMPACLTGCLSICLPPIFIRIYVSTYLRSSVCLSVCLTVCLSVCLSLYVSTFVYLPVCLHVCMLVCLYVCLIVYLYTYTYLSTFAYLPVCLFVCLFVRLFIFTHYLSWARREKIVYAMAGSLKRNSEWNMLPIKITIN